MQATLIIDDDVLAQAGQLAAERAVSIDVVVSELLRKSLSALPNGQEQFRFPTFEVPAGTPPITPDDVQRADEDF